MNSRVVLTLFVRIAYAEWVCPSSEPTEVTNIKLTAGEKIVLPEGAEVPTAVPKMFECNWIFTPLEGYLKITIHSKLDTCCYIRMMDYNLFSNSPSPFTYATVDGTLPLVFNDSIIMPSATEFSIISSSNASFLLLTIEAVPVPVLPIVNTLLEDEWAISSFSFEDMAKSRIVLNSSAQNVHLTAAQSPLCDHTGQTCLVITGTADSGQIIDIIRCEQELMKLSSGISIVCVGDDLPEAYILAKRGDDNGFQQWVGSFFSGSFSLKEHNGITALTTIASNSQVEYLEYIDCITCSDATVLTVSISENHCKQTTMFSVIANQIDYPQRVPGYLRTYQIANGSVTVTVDYNSDAWRTVKEVRNAYFASENAGSLSNRQKSDTIISAAQNVNNFSLMIYSCVIYDGELSITTDSEEITLYNSSMTTRSVITGSASIKFVQTLNTSRGAILYFSLSSQVSGTTAAFISKVLIVMTFSLRLS